MTQILACFRLVSKTISIDEMERLSGIPCTSYWRGSVGDPLPDHLKGRVCKELKDHRKPCTLITVSSDADDDADMSAHMAALIRELPSADRLRQLAAADVTLEVAFATWTDAFVRSFEVPISALADAIAGTGIRVIIETSGYPES